MEQTNIELSALLKRIIGKKSLSVIQEKTGLSKATASRLLNGQYKGRASALALWKLTTGNPDNTDYIRFSDVMLAAGYADTEIRNYEQRFSLRDDKPSNWEKQALLNVQSRLSKQGLLFNTSMTNYNGLHASILALDLPDCKEWILLFVDVDDIDLEGCFNLFGRVALCQHKRARKTSIIMRTDKLKEYAYKTSFAGALSLIVTSPQGDIQDEIYISNDGERAILIL